MAYTSTGLLQPTNKKESLRHISPMMLRHCISDMILGLEPSAALKIATSLPSDMKTRLSRPVTLLAGPRPHFPIILTFSDSGAGLYSRNDTGCLSQARFSRCSRYHLTLGGRLSVAKSCIRDGILARPAVRPDLAHAALEVSSRK